MKKLLSFLIAPILAASLALPLNAAPIFAPTTEQVRADAVEQVGHRRHWRHKHRHEKRHHWKRHHFKRRHIVRHCHYEDCYPLRYGYPYGYRTYYPRYHHRYYHRPGFSIYLQF